MSNFGILQMYYHKKIKEIQIPFNTLGCGTIEVKNRLNKQVKLLLKCAYMYSMKISH